jgi:signal transduction histidine kinase
MSFLHTLRLARKDFFKLKKHRDAPAWAMWLMAFIVALCWGMGLWIVVSLLGGKLFEAEFWERQFGPFMTTSLVIGFVFHVAYTTIERLAPQRFIDWTNGPQTLGVTLFFAVSSISLVALGMTVAYLILGGLPGQGRVELSTNRGWTSFAVFGLFISIGWGWLASMQSQQEQQSRQLKEAELKLLQAQIEPHYLFNTLANVRSLIDCDPKEAGELLDAFTDHLRASLTSMRAERVSLDTELQLVGHYLKLMQLRMGPERLQFHVQADLAAREVQLPPLLLQPLVENAIHHGLECCVEGGRVDVEARVQDGRLRIEVRDNGVGLNAPSERKGHGVATQNIRDRLLARYGETARLSLTALPNAQKGTLAAIDLPST